MTTEQEHLRHPGPAVSNQQSGPSTGHVVQAGSITGDIYIGTGSPRLVVPHQLPLAPQSFVGREQQLSLLSFPLGTHGEAQPRVTVFALVGPGGAGKTWLALHWAFAHLGHFPDGQLFVDLQGFSPTENPISPAAAIRGFLDALGVEPSTVPVDLQAQSGLLRSLLQRKRILMILDNASDAAQVVPLLPGGSDCVVVVTSRTQLPGLVNNYGAQHVDVGMLTTTEARNLMNHRLGTRRVATEPEALDELLEHCAGYPLALSIVAGRIQMRSSMSLADLAIELRDTSNLLAEFEEDDSISSLPDVLSWSYSSLSTQEARVFRLVGIAPGPDISVTTAANLTGLPERTSKAVLRRLAHISLLNHAPSGRYGMHDLIRLYARERGNDDNFRREAVEAQRRVLDFYLHTANDADQLLDPHATTPCELKATSPASHAIELKDQAHAMEWFNAEYACLQAAQDVAVRQNWHERACLLAWSLAVYRWKRGYIHDNVVACEAGLQAAQRLGNVATLTRAHRNLGAAYARIGKFDDARTQLGRALALAEETRDLPDQARAHRLLVLATQDQRANEALEHATMALTLYRSLDNRLLEADALNTVGLLTAQLGRPEEAMVHCHMALDLHRGHNDPDGEAAALEGLGIISRQLGDHTLALQHFEAAHFLFHELGYTYSEAYTLEQIGHTHAASKQHTKAHEAWKEAGKLYEKQGRFDAARNISSLLTAKSRHP
ncbi:ATP-binding protein [Amycolatopsis sp. NPDC088138]|uniref:ATP-binding protein n=1 Tax=Amycolatopsis sp. NPDC088138 TaxID=3363938 RepID=UPI00382B1BC1